MATTVDFVPSRIRRGEAALSGILVAVLVAVWAAVLVPMWAHRSSSPSQPEDLARARVITRRPLQQAVALQRHWADATARAMSHAPARSATVRRRRTILAALGGLFAVTTVAVVAGMPPALLLPSGLILVGCLAWLRRTAAQAAARREALRRRAAERRALGFRDFTTRASADVADEYPPATVAEIAQASAEAAPSAESTSAAAAPSDAPWLPVPLPLPSYVTAPPAPTVIDADWHEEALLDGELPGEASAYALGEDALQRRAVGD